MRSHTALMVLAGLALGSVTVLACSSDDDPPPPSSTPDSGTTTTTPGSSVDEDDDEVDSGTTTPAPDAGAEAGPDAGAKPLGGACSAASNASAECESGVCATFGGGGDGEPERNLCTRQCDARGPNAPKCQGSPALSGSCNGKLYCALK